MNKIRTIYIQFGNDLERKDIPAFRGAIVASLRNDNLLFHNHTDSSYRYAYPLIQYKQIHKKAAIVCIGEGSKAIGEFFSSAQFDISINRRKEKLKIEDITANQTLVQCQEEPFTYRINHWLPLNNKNYDVYRTTKSMVERIQMLEKILTGNILSALKGIGVTINESFYCTITNVNNLSSEYFKGIKLMSIDAEFQSCISLPEYIGLGRHASVGFGTLTRKSSK